MKFKSKICNKYNRLPLSVKASLWFLFSNIFQKSMMVIFTPIFTRILTTEEFSKYAVFQSWELIFSVFATLSISNYATAKALTEFKNNRDVFISSAESLTAILTIITFGIYCVIRFVYGTLSSFPLWVMVLLFIDIFTTAIFAFWSQAERFNLRYKMLVTLSIVMGVLSPGISFLLISFSNTVGIYKGWSRILGVVITDGIVGAVLLYSCIKKSKILFSNKYWKFCFSYCLPLIPHFLAMAFLQKIGQLFVDYYCGSEASGIYSLANSLAMLMMVVNDAFTKTLVPWTYQKMAEKKYKDINKPVFSALLIIAIIDFVLALIAPEVVAVFADESYAMAVYAVAPLVAVCFFGFLYNTFANVEYYFKETRLVSIASLIAGIAITLFNYVLIPLFGFLAAAYASLLSYIVYALMHYLFMKKTVKKHIPGIEIYDNKSIFKLSVVFVTSILLISMLYEWTLIRYTSLGIMCCIILFKHKTIVRYINSLYSQN